MPYFLHKSTHHPSLKKKKSLQTLLKVITIVMSADTRSRLVTLIRQNCKDFSNQF